jgi:cell wall-associated NlpC family hydrolase
VLVLDIPCFSLSKKISDGEKKHIVGSLCAGDILLTADNVFPLWRLLVCIAGKSHYSHAAVYEGNNRVIESTTFHASGDGVARTELNVFLSGRKNVCVLRPQYAAEENRQTMFAYLVRQLGKPYDYRFDACGTDAMYCTKLVARAMCAAGLPINTECFFGRNIYTPAALMKTDSIQTVYRKSQTHLNTLTAYLPLTVILLLTAALACGIHALPGMYVCLLIVLCTTLGWVQHVNLI